MLPFSDPQDNNLDKSFHDQLELPVAGSSYFPFTPTIFCLDGALHDLLLPSNSTSDVTMTAVQAAEAQQDLVHPTDSAPLYVAAAGMGDGSCGRRVRSTRKDRHSKIFTASGPRDRRMRLSIDVARRFFHLQDMLGYDKASKTVQWLLTMSKAAIKDLTAIASCSNQTPKSTESSTLSGSRNKSKCKSKSKSKSSTVTADADQERKTKAKRGATKPSSKTNLIHSALARESRAKARERARQRTKEKRRNLTSFSSSIPLDAIKEESSSQNLKSIYQNFADDIERKSCSNMVAVASERAYEYPAIAGSGLLQVLGFGNNNLQGGVAAATAAASISVDAAGSIFQEEYWADMDSFYSR